MKENKWNILVTGNGFDLYHGRKTNYTDFVKCVEEAFATPGEMRSAFQVKLTELCNVNGFFRHFHFSLADDPTWTYFEGEMDNMLAALIRFQEVVMENQKDPEYDLISYNIIGGLFSYNDLQIFKHFARIFEQIYDDPAGGLFKLRQQYITPEKVLDMRALAAEVRRELRDFTAALECYLVGCVMNHAAMQNGGSQDPEGESAGMTPDRPVLENGKLSSQIAALQPDYVINFNYTDTAALYGIPEERIYYAKGRAGHVPCNLVLGAPDESETHMEWAYLRTYFQKLVNMVGLPKREMLYPVEELPADVSADVELPFPENAAPCFAGADGRKIPVQVSFFGYSFPEEDAELIKELVCAAEKVVIFYTDREDYAHKMLRLLKLFGKDTVSAGVYDGKILWKEIR